MLIFRESDKGYWRILCITFLSFLVLLNYVNKFTLQNKKVDMVLETDIAKNMIEVDECTPRKKNRDY